jgi:hypothetical protein
MRHIIAQSLWYAVLQRFKAPDRARGRRCKEDDTSLPKQRGYGVKKV